MVVVSHLFSFLITLGTGMGSCKSRLSLLLRAILWQQAAGEPLSGKSQL